MRSVLSTLAACALAGCGLIDAATSERPDGTQMDGLGDVFSAMGAFAAVTGDPASADTGDLADMHDTRGYQKVLDPEQPASRLASRNWAPLDACATREGDSATWNCPFMIGTLSCRAMGSGMKHGDGTVSGTSTQTCIGNPRVVQVTATSVVFDEVAGRGSGVIVVEVGQPNLSGWAHVTVDNLGFCLEKSPPLPESGRVIIDGQGPLEGTPFDPMTIRFSDSPVCGTALID